MKKIILAASILLIAGTCFADWQQVYKVIPDTTTWQYEWRYRGQVGVGNDTTTVNAFMRYDGLIQGTTIYATDQFKCPDGTVFTSTSAFGGGGGSSTFLGLTDTPAVFDSGKYFKSWTSSGTWETPAGAGDMTKIVYDTDSSDVVDNSEALGGYAYTHFLDTTTADSTYLKKSEDDSSNYKLTLSSLAVTNQATVGSLSSSGQVTSNSRKVIDTIELDAFYIVGSTTAAGTTAVKISAYRDYAITITTMTVKAFGGTNCVGMIEQRARSADGSAGTDIWSGDITILTTGYIGGTVADFTVPANYALWFKPTSWTGAVTSLSFDGAGTKD